MIAFFIWGYGISLDEWSQEKQSDIKDVVQSILENKPEGKEKISTLQDMPLFVYNLDRELVYSSRGGGRQITPSDLTPFRQRGETLGYYYSGSVHFKDDIANQRFIESMSYTIWIAVILSFVISFLFALIFAKSLSAPALRVASGLDQITRGNLQVHILEKGATEIVKISHSANLLSMQLKKEQEMRKQWAQDIAHDLRTPIAVLKAQLEGMRDGVLNLTPSRIEKNMKEIGRVERLISDLEELMSLESPEKKLSRKEIKAQAVIDLLRDRFSFETSKKNINFVGKTMIDTFTADEILIQRALSNFMSNAVRHANRDGTITVLIAKIDRSVILTVSNTGELIPASEIDKVFDRLFRGECARNTPGSGLGLTISRKIAELHGGSISIRSQKDTGTEVKMTIPV